ncbi:MAG: tetraacyldisaccharide 4'-kinase [Gammaproteobacteria bacterium]|nr:tetraacyldisaccharide 4'-kinase [Gammaproteobacteria bacterium]MYH47147.1 tetraacyldisaccharide 4'-kinase [Gammaproteobacteria bacterium]MYL14912.1 tetraacyldisaccharide 4'-kinase [Gammaproteobacteria bacterium]
MNFLERAWYEGRPWLYLLWPLSMLFRGLAAYRRRRHSADASRLGKQPVIVIGNITVGGTGKTALLIALAQELKQRGMSPGIISRGYGATAANYPLVVEADSNPDECGDEPVLIAASTECPVVVDPDRPAALAHLLAEHKVNVVLSDDGLQHYRLHRDIEIAVIDGARMFGNGLLLPAGPLREPQQRLHEVDFVVVNGEAADALELPIPQYEAAMEAHSLVNLATDEERSFTGAPFHVGNTLQLVSGIGNPERFYALMESLPYPLARIEFPDHHKFNEEDFAGERIDAHQPIVMTEKDAVKCRRFATANFWALRAEMKLPPEFVKALLKRIRQAKAEAKAKT